MKNILEICNQLGIGGTEKTLQIFCKYLDKTKYKIFACGIFKGGFRENIIKEYVSDLLITNGDIEKIKNFTIKHNINIVHWHSITTNLGEEFEKSLELLKFFKEQNIKIIETAPFSLYNEKIDDLLDIKLFVSKNNLIKYFWKFGKLLKDKSKYFYLYNPIDIEELEKFRLNNNEKIELRKKYGISKNDFVVGKVGRASLWKWEDTIIDIVFLLKDEIKNLKIVIRAMPKLKIEKVKRLGVEKYFLFLDETVSEKKITETYQLMDLMLHTSRMGESFGIAITEGMFFGLPIITKNTDFLKKTLVDRDNAQIEIINNYENGFISNNLDEIYKYILDLFNNKNKINQISINNITRVKELFEAKNITKKLESIFEGVENFKFDFDFEKEFGEYKKLQNKESLYSLIKININSLYDKYINKA